MKHSAFALFILTIFFSVGVSFAKAQVGSIMGTMNDVTINVAPEIPEPNSEVLVQARSYLVNLTAADFTWAVDGKSYKSGVGLRDIKVKLGDTGVPVKIDVNIFAVGGYPINKEIIVTPSSMDILWEATDSNVPPFYKGKALPTNMGKIKYVAIPNIKNSAGTYSNPNELVYKWTKDYDLDIAASGYGKNTYNVDMGADDSEENIGVTAIVRGGGFSAQKYITTGVYDPKIVWYATSPLFGPQFERAINDGFSIKSSDVSIFAEPFFASPKNGVVSDNLSYTWQLNNNDIGNQKPANILTLHRNNNNSGTAIVDLNIDDSNKGLVELKSTLMLYLQ